MPEILERDEHYQRLLELKAKVKSLNEIILEGQHAEEFVKSHPFYGILHRTLIVIRDVYNADAHKAARDSRAEIANFLGREEAIKEILDLIPQFSVKADSAEVEKKLVEEEIKELQQILASPEGTTQDNGGSL